MKSLKKMYSDYIQGKHEKEKNKAMEKAKADPVYNMCCSILKHFDTTLIATKMMNGSVAVMYIDENGFIHFDSTDEAIITDDKLTCI